MEDLKINFSLSQCTSYIHCVLIYTFYFTFYASENKNGERTEGVRCGGGKSSEGISIGIKHHRNVWKKFIYIIFKIYVIKIIYNI